MLKNGRGDPALLNYREAGNKRMNVSKRPAVYITCDMRQQYCWQNRRKGDGQSPFDSIDGGVRIITGRCAFIRKKTR